MIRKLVFILIAFCSVIPAKAQSLEIYFDYKRFFTPESKGILEIYLQVNVNTIMLKSLDNGLYKGKVEVTSIIHKGDSIFDFRKKIMESPDFTDSTIVDFIDQHRYILPEGMYEMEITARDLHLDSGKIISTRVPITIEGGSEKIRFSDVQQIESYSKASAQGPLTKSGYDLVPFVSNYFTNDVNKIAYYTEIYNTLSLGAGEQFILNQFITDASGKVVDGYFRFSRQTAGEIIPVLGVFDISKLTSGKYFLVLEAKNRNNEIISGQKFEFFRTRYDNEYSSTDFLSLDIKATFVNNILDEDTLSEYIACLRPIAGRVEAEIIDTIIQHRGNLLSKQQFFYSFWQGRDPLSPDYAWLKYKKAVDDVNRMFSTKIRKGYETDRGIIFLKYGAPDDVMDRPNEPSSYPYQVWHYHKLGQFNNKRFIFYMPDLVTNEYSMLHSDVPGEVKNYRWEQMLNSRTSPNVDIDNSNGGNQNHWGGNSNEFFKNPR